MRRRNIDKVVRGRRQPHLPVAERVWKVTAKEVSGAALHPATFLEERQARNHADWWHNHPGIVDVELHAPEEPTAALVKRYIPTAEDTQVGEWLAAALDDPKVCPTMKFDINRWLDSKAWGHEAQKEIA